MGDAQGFFLVLDQPLAAGHDRDAGLLGQLPRLVLVAESFHGLVRWADELDAALPADLGEVGIFREESVTGMDGLDVGHLGGADDARDLQIAFGGRGWADADGVVGQFEIRRIAVGRAVDGDDFDAEILAGADDPQGDLTTIGDEDALEHGRELQNAKCKMQIAN